MTINHVIQYICYKCYVNFNSLNRDVYIELHNSNMNDVYNM